MEVREVGGGRRVKVKRVRSGIRTHAHESGLRPERSALDRSAILTCGATHHPLPTL